MHQLAAHPQAGKHLNQHPQALPVILFYMTAMVMPADQTLYFGDDIYGHDTKHARALASRRVVTAF